MFFFLLLASCGAEPEKADGAVDVPQPSGPPIAQQADAVPSSAPDRSGLAWETAATGEGTALRLVQPGGTLLLSIACLGLPPRLVVTAPGFSSVGSEDRFSLGVGEEPVTLVADPTRQGQRGVVAEGAVPHRLSALLDEAEEVSALYGTQRIGPVPAPPEPLREALARSCSRSK